MIDKYMFVLNMLSSKNKGIIIIIIISQVLEVARNGKTGKYLPSLS